MALCPLYGPLPTLRPSILFMTLCFLNSSLSPLRHLSDLCPLFSLRPLSFLQPLSPLHPYVLSTAFFAPLYSVPSMALCSLYGPMSPPRPSTVSTAICSLCGALSSQWPSVSSKPSATSTALIPSIALCPL
jgi:hypothetical protein